MKNLQTKSVVNTLTAFFQKIEDKFNAPIKVSLPGEADEYIDGLGINVMYNFDIEDPNGIMLSTDGMLLDIIENGMVDELDYSELHDEFHALLDDTTWNIEHQNYGVFHLYKEVA